MTALRFLTLILLAAGSIAQSAEDALPSWRDGPSKTAIVAFVTEVTDQGGDDYVSPDERIAVFDNDGTLWASNQLISSSFARLIVCDN